MTPPPKPLDGLLEIEDKRQEARHAKFRRLSEEAPSQKRGVVEQWRDRRARGARVAIS